MRRMLASIVALALAVATVAIAWSASPGATAGDGVTAAAHALMHAADGGGLPVHGAHAHGVSTEDCVAMALGCVGLAAQLAATAEPAAPDALRLAVGRPDLRRVGRAPDLPERPPKA